MWAFLFLALVGCSENQLRQIQHTEPNIVIEPASIEFGAVDASTGSVSQQVKFKNIGEEVLEIQPLFFSSPTQVFSFSPLEDLELEPDEETLSTVSFDPITYSDDYAEIKVISNDEESPNLSVTLHGKGGAPVIKFEPQPGFFADTPVGCEDVLETTISNVGNVDLQISSVEYFVSVPDDILLGNAAPDFTGFPWTIHPNESISIPLSYLPKDEINDSAFFKIESNDPVNPVIMPEQEGVGFYGNWITDSFTQSGTSYSDIIFVIDNSGSMGEEQANMALNFSRFMNALTLLSVDYHIGVITTDSPVFRGPFIDNSTPDPVAELSTQIQAGTGGSSIEMGIEMAYQALYPLGDAAPGSSFFRNAAYLVVIFISDEEDQSPSYLPFYESYFLSLKPIPDMVALHAVAGDYPFGCSTAQFGVGYYEIVNHFGGQFLSICSSDWGVGMETLAINSAGSLSFPLSEQAIGETVKVYIDGVEIVSGWSYNQAGNFVTFDSTSQPASGERVEIKYAAASEC